MSMELASAYISLVPSFRGGKAAIAKELAPAEAAASKSGATAGAGFAAAMKGKAGAGGTALGVGLSLGVLKLGSDFQSAYKTIRVGTGETGKALQGLKGDFKAVLSQRPENMRDVATAITGVEKASGATGKPLQELTKTYLRLSGLTGTDLAGNLKATRPLFTSFGVAAEGQTAKLDQLYRAAREGGVSVAELSQAMTSAGPAARTLGLDFTKSAALVTTFAKSGLGAGAVSASLTKFISGAGARQTAAAKKVAAAQKEVLSAQLAVNSATKPSPAQLDKLATANAKLANTQDDLKRAQAPLPKQFAATLAQIKQAPNALDAAAVASQAFGARSGPKLAEMLRSGKVSYDDLIKSIGGGKDTIQKSADDTQTMAGKLKILKNSFLTAIEPLASGAFDAGTKLLAKWGPIIARIVQRGGNMPGWVKRTAGALVGLGVGLKVLGKVHSGVTKITGAARSMAGAVGRAKGFFTSTGSSGYSKIDRLRLGFMRAREAGSKLWGGVKSGASTLAGYAKTAASTAVSIAKTTGAWIAQKAALVASKAATIASTIAEKAAAVAQWALNAAMSANPVTLIVIALVALVAGIVVAYKKIGWFRDFVDAAFSKIKAIVGAAIGFIKTHWSTILAILTGPIGVAVLAIVKNWDKIKVGFTAVRDWIHDRVGDIVGFVTGIPGRIGRTVSTMWDGLKSSTRAVRQFVKDRIDAIVGFVHDLPGRAKRMLQSIGRVFLSPFRLAFKGVAQLWNKTMGKIHFKVPSWVPGFGGKGWGFPTIDLTKFHTGGVVPGRPGEEVPVLALAGERILSPRQTRAYDMARRPDAPARSGFLDERPLHVHGNTQAQIMAAIRAVALADGAQVAVMS